MKSLVFAVLVSVALAGCGVEWFPDNPAPTTTTNTSGLAVATTSLPNATVGTAYSQTLAATGGTTPYTWTTTSGSLPAGLTLSTAGVISGTPTTAVTATFTVQVKDSASPAATATQALTLQVI